jgi:urease accessory protein
MPTTITIEIPMTAHDRRRVRRIIEAPDGTRFPLELPTGTVLQPGQRLHQDGARAYVVAAAPEDVLVIRPRDVAEAARVGHLIGNLHRDIEADGAEVVALADAALADRLGRAGVRFIEDRRPFQGRAPGEHAH